MNNYKEFLNCNLSKKNILLTGASGNLGTAFANFLLFMGANLILTDINTLKLKKKFKKNKKVIIYTLDVSNYNHWKNLKKKILKKNIKIDVLINNAGYTNHSNKKNFNNNFFKIDVKSIEEVFKVNVFGILYGCKIFGKEMVKNRNGSIINIASMYALQSPRHYLYKNTNISAPITYTASKFSVIAITKYLGTLLASDGVRVNSISPGGIQDKSHKKIWLNRFAKNNPSKRMGKPDELFNALIYLINEKSSYNNGSNIVVDGGWTAW